jgi:hypothetical protein
MVEEAKKEGIFGKLSESFKKITGALGGIEAVDIGDIEIIKIGHDIIVSLPHGKDTFLVHRIPFGKSEVSKLSEVV